MSKEYGYGFFPGGDPRKFQPDEESNTEEELEAWRLACAEWDKGNQVDIGGSCVLINGMIFTFSGYGLGSYEYDIDEPDDDGPELVIVNPPAEGFEVGYQDDDPARDG